MDGLLRGEPFEREADSFAGQKDATVSLSDRHVPVPIGVSKVPEASGFFRGVAELGVVTVLGATFHEVNPVARGRLKLVDVRQAPSQLASLNDSWDAFKVSPQSCGSDRKRIQHF